MVPQIVGEKDFVFVKNLIKLKKYGGNFYVIETNFDSGCELRLLQSYHVRYLDDLTPSSVK